MKQKRLIAWNALILAGTVVGCSSTNGSRSFNYIDPDSVKLPVKFSGYRSFYTFVAQYENAGLFSEVNDALLKLASDSTTKIITMYNEKAISYLYLVTPHYLGGGIFDGLRGQGGGNYYVLRPLGTNDSELNPDKGFELVGILAGGSFQYISAMNKPTFITHWHGAPEDTTYEWNGKYFEVKK